MPRRVVTAALSPVARDANRNGNRNFPRVHAARRPERAHHYEIGRVHLGSAPRLVPPAHRGSPSAGVAPGLDSLGTAVPGATSSSRCARPPTTPSLGQTLAGSPGGTCGAAQRGWGRCFGDGLARWRRRGANRLGHRRDRGPEDRLFHPWRALFGVATITEQSPAANNCVASGRAALHPAVVSARDLRRRAGLTPSLTSLQVLARVVVLFRQAAGSSAGPGRRCDGDGQRA
jgi:hypothetical protein